MLKKNCLICAWIPAVAGMTLVDSAKFRGDSPAEAKHPTKQIDAILLEPAVKRNMHAQLLIQETVTHKVILGSSY